MDYGCNYSYQNRSSGEMRLIISKSTHHPTNKKPRYLAGLYSLLDLRPFA